MSAFTLFTIYDPASGRILRSGCILADSAQSQAQSGEAVLEGVQGDWRTQRVEIAAGVPQVVDIPPTEPTLAERKATALARLAARRWEIETSGITVGAARIATDRESQSTLNGALTFLSLGLAGSVMWKTETGAFVAADLMTIRGFAEAVGAHVQACFARECAIATAIAAAPDAAALETAAVLIQPFWPVTP